MEESNFAHELHNSARKCYRFFCLNVARCLSYVGGRLEPYTTQNQLMTLVTPTNRLAILHLPNNQKHHCPIFQFTNVDETYVAYAGHIQKELVNVKRFYSYFRNTSRRDSISISKDNNFQDLVAATVEAHKIELNYIDPLKEYLNVVFDKDREEFMEIFVEIDDSPTNSEPTFEDVMTLWIAVFIWAIQLIVGRLLYKKVAFRITGKIYGLIQ
ncbi:hypothetical protein RhiirA5_358569 [Rhizophagus irregularis]|uniref:Uncharacterized protein n=5 Tax=Rhizophagus irregularis TaxID=588596 RepID=U9U6N1_RHIID|nr:hypothetical protein GLOIN_2v1693877 [Rhizophagus irregularis DAOM 181602=DAOM 197198]EXX61167.1 hypothetical protein RirG_173520 [Rhizophagus irregularis DAOM 197198w]PKC07931.1 hypothetical protein RhiirA5_358569 [Rhizophagus irregularis]PKC64634.1 hypothetical protein RhiirA1_421378 [Rhizophagus irregularis]PKY23389.1 hypothetical protein RhiirB3_411710 [Rhizophagus irregularis]POG62666.1 hypothetical protein GLOIN_2v1693877 [Rhizophagus irregularis DAOM 181602=DAOM 197198]|eukprot:XP_025169532.1 hypothetical protein GLOIN_2v1693877 [Rhizophagus irregularis DAOM 181602=DAOM 197198]